MPTKDDPADMPPSSPPAEREEKTGLTNMIERKLVTILSADVAGYSKLMDSDEEYTLKVFRGHKKVFEQLVELHRGRIFNTAGDAILAEFTSAVEGVRCATEIQSALRTRNEKLPEAKRVQFRIGVNLGDVIVQGTDLLGDGVNLAARVQTSAEPGGVCLSGSVWDQVQNKLALNVNPLGEVSYKNIPNPVRTFSVLIEKGEHSGVIPPGKATAKNSHSRLQGTAFFVACAAVLVVSSLTLYFVLRGRAGKPGVNEVVVKYDHSNGAIQAEAGPVSQPAKQEVVPDASPAPAAASAQSVPPAQAEGVKIFSLAKPVFQRAWKNPEGKAAAKWLVAPGQASGNARPTIAEAVAAAARGDVIEIRPGTYRETVLIDKDLTLRGLPSESGEVAVTVDWDGSETLTLQDGKVTLENMNVLVTSKDSKAAAAVLVNGARAKLFNVAGFASGASGSSGFSLRSGDAEVWFSEFRGVRGIEQLAGKLTCQHCSAVEAEEEGVVVFNQGNDPAFRSFFRKLHVQGAKVNGFVVMSQTAVSVEDCEITGNGVNGAMLIGDGRGKFTDCAITGNKENGFVLAETASAEVRKAKATQNGFSGFAATGKATLDVRESEITGNGEFGVAVLNDAQVKESGNRNVGNRNGATWRAPASAPAKAP